MNLADRQTVLEHMLAEHRVVTLVVSNTHSTGIPEGFKGDGVTRLDVGLDLPVPIRDLRIDEDGLSGGFSFGGRQYPVWVVWDALIAVYVDSRFDAQGRCYSISWPTTVRIGEEEEPEPPKKRPSARRGHLKAVK